MNALAAPPPGADAPPAWADPGPGPDPAPADPAPPPAPEGGHLVDKHFRLISFETHVWEGRRTTSAVKATVNGQEVAAGRASDPRVSLVPEELRLAASRARDAIYAVLDRHTIPTARGPAARRGSRLVPLTGAEALVAELGPAIADFDAVADRFVAEHDAIVAHNRDYWIPVLQGDEAAYQELIGRLIPPKTAIRRLFSVAYRLEDDAGEAARSTLGSAAVRAFFAEAAANAARYRAELEALAVTAPIEGFAQALAAVKDQVDHSDRVTPETFNALAAAATLCRSWKDTMAPEVFDVICGVGDRVDAAVRAMKAAKDRGDTYKAAFAGYREALGQALAGAASAVAAEAQAARAAARAGARPRALLLAPPPGEPADPADPS